MRPIYTREQLDAAEIDRHGRDYSVSDDGWDDMEVAGKDGWRTVSGWGRDGWDLGDWPYVVISVRSTRAGKNGLDRDVQEMCQTVEGDTTVYRFDTPEDRDAAIDYLFIWYGIGREYPEWETEGLGPRWNDETSHYDSRDALDAGTLRVPERFRGPFSWARCDAEVEP